MKTLSVCFFGHRNIGCFSRVGELVEQTIESLLRQNEFVEFLVGREWDFDQIVSSAIVKAKRDYGTDSLCHTLVLPYMKADYKNNIATFENYYDEIEICDQSASAYPKAAIQIRNHYLVDRSDYCVFYVEHKAGGAWQTMRYALKQEKRVVNLAEKELI